MPRAFPKFPPTSVEAEASGLKRIRILSHLLDNVIPIPGTTYRIGIDPLLGLLPGVGDIVGAVLSAYIVLEAAQFGLPRTALARMILNIISETALGSLPVLGDFLDATWKANSRNMALLEAHLDRPRPSQQTDWWFLILLLAGLMLFVIGLAALGVFLLGLLIRATGS